MYYLNSRYYNPEIGRFINADDVSYLEPGSLNGLNLYTYCENNPVMMVDPSGYSPEWWEWAISSTLIVGGIALCATGIGTGIGASLIVAGGSMMASNIMSAAGVEGKTASIISSGLNITAGTALMFIPGTQALGASMIGSGIGGIAGGYISQALGYSFTTGAAIGSFAGAIIGGQVHKGIQASAALKAQPIGTPFNPNGTLTQIGVDPNTLTISRTLNPAKLSAVRTTINKSGMYGTIRVMQNGYIIDGNHRVAVARLLGIAVDVVIG